MHLTFLKPDVVPGRWLGHARNLVCTGCVAVLTLARAEGEEGQPVIAQTHAAFFSAEAGVSPPLDPQVFVAAPNAPAKIGPQQIAHAAGLRNPLISDNPDLPILNAEGKPLDMSLGAWLSASAEVSLALQPDGYQKVTVVLRGLKPGGRYSLFENHFDQTPVGFTPLDGRGTENSFLADARGTAVMTNYAPRALTHDNAVLVVYHSDGKSHGLLRGRPGVDAHHQLIVRP